MPLIPKVPGYIVAVHVTDNQPVRKGDLLIEIDAADYQIRVDRAAAANIRAAEAEVDRAASELKRLKGIGPAYVSRKQMDEAIGRRPRRAGASGRCAGAAPAGH